MGKLEFKSLEIHCGKEMNIDKPVHEMLPGPIMILNKCFIWPIYIDERPFGPVVSVCLEIFYGIFLAFSVIIALFGFALL